MRGYEDVMIDTGDLVFYQYEDKKAWLESKKVFTVNEGDVFIFANGNIRNIPRCNVQLSKKSEEIQRDDMEGNMTRVRFEEKDSEGFGDEIEKQDIEEVSKRVTRSMTDAKRKEMRREEILTFWTQVQNLECFDDIAIYTEEIPLSKQNTPEVKEAKDI